jgi:hypothetical protein
MIEAVERWEQKYNGRPPKMEKKVLWGNNGTKTTA